MVREFLKEKGSVRILIIIVAIISYIAQPFFVDIYKNGKETLQYAKCGIYPIVAEHKMQIHPTNNKYTRIRYEKNNDSCIEAWLVKANTNFENIQFNKMAVDRELIKQGMSSKIMGKLNNKVKYNFFNSDLIITDMDIWENDEFAFVFEIEGEGIKNIRDDINKKIQDKKNVQQYPWIKIDDKKPLRELKIYTDYEFYKNALIFTLVLIFTFSLFILFFLAFKKLDKRKSHQIKLKL